MRRFSLAFLACTLLVIVVTGCDIPKPPPELPTATPGSQNPESVQSLPNLTPVLPTPDRGLTPIAAAPGYIYFVRNSRLWRIAPDGTGEKQLSDLPVTNPAQPSPDGSQLAWVSGRDLYVMPEAGGAARRIYSGDIVDRQRLGWSFDGALLGFTTYDLSTIGNEKAWYIPASGGDATLLTTLQGAAVGRGPVYEPSVQWSPDGRWVIVAGVTNPLRLLRWPLSTAREGDVRDIPGGEPDWSPDSRTFIYSETLNGALELYYVLESEATPFRNELQHVGTGLGEYSEGPGPRWSPASAGIDSDLFAYRSSSPEGEPRVSIRRRGGREILPLPSLTNNPSWSPSGDRLVIETGTVKNDALGLKWTPSGLMLVTVNAEGPHVVAPLVKDAQWPVWGK